MILPYPLRLLCLCFASFFVLNAAAGLFISFASGYVVRVAQSRAPAAAARFLLAFRVLPSALAVLFVVGLCIPSYLRFEPALRAERVGLVCLLFGLLGAATWFLALARSSHSLFISLRHHRLCRLAGWETGIPGKVPPFVVVESEAPLLAMFGLFRSHLVISPGVLRALSPEELDAALAHERAHHASRDNIKRLLFLLAPDIFPLVRPLRFLERHWSKFTEWAADDQAVAGDSGRALSLAAALVHVARMGAGPRLPFLSTSLLECDRDLSARVDRLLHLSPVTLAAPSQPRYAQSLLGGPGLMLVAGLSLLLLTPSTLSAVHKFLERFIH